MFAFLLIFRIEPVEIKRKRKKAGETSILFNQLQIDGGRKFFFSLLSFIFGIFWKKVLFLTLPLS